MIWSRTAAAAFSYPNDRRHRGTWKIISRQLQHGREKKICRYEGKEYSQFLYIGNLRIAIPTALAELERGSKIPVRVSIEEKHPHLYCYTLLSRDDDPAARLAIHVGRENVAEEKFMG